jgi:hypothetical protein
MNSRLLLMASMFLVAAVAVSGRGPSWHDVRDLGGALARSEQPRVQRGGGPPGAPAGAPPGSAATSPLTQNVALPENPTGLHRWTAFPVHYCIDETQEGFLPIPDLHALTATAFTSWGVPTVDDGACRRGNTTGDRNNEIGWGHPPGGSLPGAAVLEAGVTLTTYSQCTANCSPDGTADLLEADIIIEKAAPREFRSERCLYSTLLHETGHFLGIQHLPPPAVMQPETSDCPIKLTRADIDELVARYGALATPNAAAYQP